MGYFILYNMRMFQIGYVFWVFRQDSKSKDKLRDCGKKMQGKDLGQERQGPAAGMQRCGGTGR